MGVNNLQRVVSCCRVVDREFGEFSEFLSRCGDYWQQAELRTDGACRIMMMMMSGPAGSRTVPQLLSCDSNAVTTAPPSTHSSCRMTALQYCAIPGHSTVWWRMLVYTSCILIIQKYTITRKQGWKKIMIFNKKIEKIRFFFDLNRIFLIF